MRNIFKKQKTKEELIREQYSKSLETSTRHYNGVRINETLLGRIRSAKMDEIFESDSSNLKLHSSTERPQNFGTDFFAWFNFIREEAKQLMIKNQNFIEEERQYQKNLEEKKQKEFSEKRRKFFQEIGLLHQVA